MGTKIGRFVVDGHIHCGKKDTAKGDSKVKGIQAEVESVDNSGMALYDMNAYGIDMGILLPSFTGTSNELYRDICRRNPTRFRTCAIDTKTRLAAAHGTPWTMEAALKELDDCFSNNEDGMYVGIGEFAPGSMGVMRERPTRMERYKEWLQIAEFCCHYDIPCYFHEYSPINLDEPFTMICNVCMKFPNFKVIIAHGGGERPQDIDKAVWLASINEHIYLETGYWRAENYEYALRNPMVGASKLIWGGGDTGSRLWYPQIFHGAKNALKTSVYNNRNNWIWNGTREVDYQVDYYGWACRQIDKVVNEEMATQDEVNLIVGGNAARLYKLPVDKDCTFAAGRPDLNLPPREIMYAEGVTERAAYALSEDEDFRPGTQPFWG